MYVPEQWQEWLRAYTSDVSSWRGERLVRQALTMLDNCVGYKLEDTSYGWVQDLGELLFPGEHFVAYYSTWDDGFSVARCPIYWSMSELEHDDEHGHVLSAPHIVKSVFDVNKGKGVIFVRGIDAKFSHAVLAVKRLDDSNICRRERVGIEDILSDGGVLSKSDEASDDRDVL